MDCGDILLNLDWDPCYLSSIFDEDFYDMSSLWDKQVTDSEMMEINLDRQVYCPIVEDISLEDEVLRDAVERIESE